MVGIISVVIGGHFGGGDHFDGGDHFGGGTGLKRFSCFFLGNEQIFRRKNYMAFVHLLKSISMQKKSDFYFLSLAAHWSIFAWSCS